MRVDGVKEQRRYEDRVAEQNISTSKTYWASINYEYYIQKDKYLGRKISFHNSIIQHIKDYPYPK